MPGIGTSCGYITGGRLIIAEVHKGPEHVCGRQWIIRKILRYSGMTVLRADPKECWLVVHLGAIR